MSGAGASAESGVRDIMLDAPNGREETVEVEAETIVEAEAETVVAEAETVEVEAETIVAEAETVEVEAVTVVAEAVTVEVEAVAVVVQTDASSEALISARGNEDSRSGNRVNVEARALVTRTGARTPETRSSGAVDALVNDGCTPA